MKRLIAAVVLVSGAVNGGLAPNSDAQVPSAKPRTSETETAQTRPTSPKVYEDDEVKIPIPADWKIATDDHPAIAPYDGAGSSIISAKGKLLLAKNGYTLALSYHTEQVSGIIRGRFIEVLRIPWLSVDEAWDCSLHLGSYPSYLHGHSALSRASFRQSGGKGLLSDTTLIPGKVLSIYLCDVRPASRGIASRRMGVWGVVRQNSGRLCNQ